MATVVSRYPKRGPSIIELAWAHLRAADKPEAKKSSKPEEKPEVAHPKDEPLRSESYRRLVAARPCKNCGRHKHSQAAHVPPAGKAIKQDDRETFPLCADGPYGKGCHPKFDQFELMPRAKAVQQGKKWAAQTRAEIEAEGQWPKRLPKWKGRKT